MDHHLIHSEPLVIAPVLFDQNADFVRKSIRSHINFIASIEIEEVRPGALFAHQGVESG